PDVQRYELWVIPQGYNLLLLVRNLPESPQLGQIYSRYDPISEFADPPNLLLDPPTDESRRRSVDQSLLIVHHQLTEHLIFIKLGLQEARKRLRLLNVILRPRLNRDPRPPRDGRHDQSGRNRLDVG